MATTRPSRELATRYRPTTMTLPRFEVYAFVIYYSPTYWKPFKTTSLAAFIAI